MGDDTTFMYYMKHGLSAMTGKCTKRPAGAAQQLQLRRCIGATTPAEDVYMLPQVDTQYTPISSIVTSKFLSP